IEVLTRPASPRTSNPPISAASLAPPPSSSTGNATTAPTTWTPLPQRSTPNANASPPSPDPGPDPPIGFRHSASSECTARLTADVVSHVGLGRRCGCHYRSTGGGTR